MAYVKHQAVVTSRISRLSLQNAGTLDHAHFFSHQLSIAIQLNLYWREQSVQQRATGRKAGEASSSAGRSQTFLLLTPFRLVVGPTHPPIKWVQGAVFQEVNLMEREADK